MPFVVSVPIKNVIFHRYVSLPEGMFFFAIAFWRGSFREFSKDQFSESCCKLNVFCFRMPLYDFHYQLAQTFRSFGRESLLIYVSMPGFCMPYVMTMIDFLYFPQCFLGHRGSQKSSKSWLMVLKQPRWLWRYHITLEPTTQAFAGWELPKILILVYIEALANQSPFIES